jgi:hypothetical protein
MINELDNPFSVTKATEFTDFEINDYWVNFSSTDNATLLNPREFLPKYIIGGKGCGKTHILRYFSFPLQKIRHQNNVNVILSIDKYIGLYSVFHGLNSSRFEGKGIDVEQWESIFTYYFELYVCDSYLCTIKEIFEGLDIDLDAEANVVSKFLPLFSNYEQLTEISSLDAVIKLLADLRRKIDGQILNAAFTRKLNYEEVRVYFSPGDLIFGLPQVVSSSLEAFSDVRIIFIFDEYEKLFDWQKKLVNTLVWDKKNPVTFWIGARRYGYTTRETKSGEMMKPGSEFQEINLDLIIRNNEDIYKQFARNLYTNRLVKYYESKGFYPNAEEVSKKFCDRFEKYDENEFVQGIIDKKSRRKEYKHLGEFRKKIAKSIRYRDPKCDIEDPGILKFIDSLVQLITSDTDNNPLDQKYKLFYFYQSWYQYKNWNNEGAQSALLNIGQNVEAEFKKFKAGQKSDFSDIKEKRKKDLIAQLARENGIKNAENSGVEKFIDLSQGNARSFILILKKVVEFSKIRGEKPLDEGGKISLDSQYLAVYDTARWFYEDAELIGDSGKNMYGSLKNLTDYITLHRFCDKPTETTVSTFYIKNNELSEKALNCLEIMVVHSILIENSEGRSEKNSGIKEREFQLNKILAPLWSLPTVERGTLYFRKEVAEAIFNPESYTFFEGIYKNRKNELNAPNFLKVHTEYKEGNTLFDKF